PVRASLRLGAHPVGCTEVPTLAAVDESLGLVRRARLARAVAFTSAVMRRLSEGIEHLLGCLTEDTPKAAALKHSYPDWVAELWWEELGRDDALALMRAQNEPPERVVRLNHRRAGTIAGTPDPDLPRAWHVERVDEDAFEAGLIWPQSRGSQLAGVVVGSRPGERTLDLCAAPGGKATQLEGDVVAVELHAGRARELEENCRRLGADNVTVVNADATKLPPDLTGFDRVLVDAPCSGLGVLAGRPDLRWRAEPLPELQLELLRVAAERVKPGGSIVYSVCTINPAETVGMV